MAHPEDLKDHELLTDLCTIGSGLTSWEVNFIDTNTKCLKNGWMDELSVRQREISEELWRKFFG